MSTLFKVKSTAFYPLQNRECSCNWKIVSSWLYSNNDNCINWCWLISLAFKIHTPKNRTSWHSNWTETELTLAKEHFHLSLRERWGWSQGLLIFFFASPNHTHHRVIDTQNEYLVEWNYSIHNITKWYAHRSPLHHSGKWMILLEERSLARIDSSSSLSGPKD